MSDFQLSADQQETLRQTIERALELAGRYEGTEAEHHQLVDDADLLGRTSDQYLKEAGITPIGMNADELMAFDVMRAETERDLAVAAGAPRTSVAELLDKADTQFREKLRAGRISFTVVQTAFDFLPEGAPGAGEERGPRGGDIDRSNNYRIEPRFEQLTEALYDQGVFTDQIIVYRGAGLTREGKKSLYNVVQIPSLNREILISNQTGLALFIGTGQRGPEFWAEVVRSDLGQHRGIYRVTHHPKWIKKALDLLLQDNPRGYVTLYEQSKREPILSGPVQEQRGLVRQILLATQTYARTHEGKLPQIKTHDTVDGMMGYTWAELNRALWDHKQRFCSDSVASLFALYKHCGVTKVYGIVNWDSLKEAIAAVDAAPPAAAVQSVAVVEPAAPVAVEKEPVTESLAQAAQEVGTPNVVGKDATLSPALQEMEEAVIGAALKFYRKNKFLPVAQDEKVVGWKKKTTWRSLNAVVRRAFKEQGLPGVTGLYEKHGLRVKGWDDRGAILQAIARLDAAGPTADRPAITGETGTTPKSPKDGPA